MATKKESNLDSKSTLVDADKVRIINSADSDDSESITVANLKTYLDANLSFRGSVSEYDPAGSYTITDSDGYTHIISSATGTITLPTLADNYNRIITITRDVASSTTALIIDGEGSETIAGNTSEYLYGLNATITLRASQAAGEWVYVDTPYDPYIVSYESNTNTVQSSPSSGTWYNLTSHTINIPAGKWILKYDSLSMCRVTTAAEDLFLFLTLSTTTSTESEKDFTTGVRGKPVQAVTCQFSMESEPVTLSAADDYYLNIKATFTGTVDHLGTLANNVPTFIRAIRTF